jgi:hypothetical protein
MVHTGSIISISRYGQKKLGCGPLSSSSFEESLEQFLRAGINGIKESTDSVSTSIMLGKIPKIGTGIFDMVIDIPKLVNSKPQKPLTVLKTVVERHESPTKKDDSVEKKSIFKQQFIKKSSFF